MTEAAGRDMTALIETARRRQNRRLVVVTASLVVLPLTGALVGLAVWRPEAQLSPVAVLLVLAVALLGPLLGAGLVTAARRRGATWVQPSPLMGLDRGHRRRILKALRRGEPIAAADREVAAHLVNQVRRNRWLPLMCTAPMLLQAMYLGSDDAMGTLARVVVPLGLVLCAWQFFVHHRIASRTDL
jgi:hypothetical protein